MHLNGQAYRAVEIFDQAVVFYAAEQLFGMRGEQVVEKYIRAFHHRNPVAFAEVDGIYRFHLARNPFFGERVVSRVVIHQRTEPRAADIVAEHAVALENTGVRTMRAICSSVALHLHSGLSFISVSPPLRGRA